MNKPTFLPILFLFLIVVGCKTQTLAIKYSGDVAVYPIDYTPKQVMFLPMQHIGEKAYYEDVAEKIDSLRNEDFVIYYESIANPKELDSTINDQSIRKIRKLLGYNLLNRYNKGNNLFENKMKLASYEPLVTQKNSMLGISGKDKRVDIPAFQLIEMFEEKYGEVKLSKCDYKTELNSADYSCKSAKKIEMHLFKKEFIIDARDKYLADFIKTSNHQKILIIYGSAHLEGVEELLTN